MGSAAARLVRVALGIANAKKFQTAWGYSVDVVEAPSFCPKYHPFLKPSATVCYSSNHIPPTLRMPSL